jgi:hypothetical protein
MKTLAMLKHNEIDPSKIFVFVADDVEYENYSRSTPRHLYGKMIVGIVGLVAQREFITDYFDEDVRIFTCDDDLESIDLSMTEHANLDTFVRYAFSECDKQGVHIFGIYPCYNPYFRQKRKAMTTTLTYLCGYCYGYINKKDAPVKLTVTRENGEKEDFEKTVLYYMMDGKTLRFNRVAAKTKYYNTVGGLGTHASRIERADKAVDLLVEKYIGYGVKKIRKNGMAEWLLKRNLRMDTFYD